LNQPIKINQRNVLCAPKAIVVMLPPRDPLCRHRA
jgi:hypothetical protein